MNLRTAYIYTLPNPLWYWSNKYSRFLCSRLKTVSRCYFSLFIPLLPVALVRPGTAGGRRSPSDEMWVPASSMLVLLGATAALFELE